MMRRSPLPQVHPLEGCELRHGRIAAILPGAGVDGDHGTTSRSNVAASAPCKASIQAGRYDKWQIRKQIEEEIKSAPVVIYTYDWSPFSSEVPGVSQLQ
eukprot:Skav231726  [mRNA]  locus=scaffold2515:216152:217084:- [translate_table: standard]